MVNSVVQLNAQDFKVCQAMTTSTAGSYTAGTLQNPPANKIDGQVHLEKYTGSPAGFAIFQCVGGSWTEQFYCPTAIDVVVAPIATVPTATGNTTNLNSLVVDPNGEIWMIDANGDAVKVEMNITIPPETVTTIVDNGDGTFTYTNEDGTPVTVSGEDLVRVENDLYYDNGVLKVGSELTGDTITDLNGNNRIHEGSSHLFRIEPDGEIFVERKSDGSYNQINGLALNMYRASTGGPSYIQQLNPNAQGIAFNINGVGSNAEIHLDGNGNTYFGTRNPATKIPVAPDGTDPKVYVSGKTVLDSSIPDDSGVWINSLDLASPQLTLDQANPIAIDDDGKVVNVNTVIKYQGSLLPRLNTGQRTPADWITPASYLFANQTLWKGHDQVRTASVSTRFNAPAGKQWRLTLHVEYNLYYNTTQQLIEHNIHGIDIIVNGSRSGLGGLNHRRYRMENEVDISVDDYFGGPSIYDAIFNIPNGTSSIETRHFVYARDGQTVNNDTRLVDGTAYTLELVNL